MLVESLPTPSTLRTVSTWLLAIAHPCRRLLSVAVRCSILCHPSRCLGAPLQAPRERRGEYTRSTASAPPPRPPSTVLRPKAAPLLCTESGTLTVGAIQRRCSTRRLRCCQTSLT